MNFTCSGLISGNYTLVASAAGSSAVGSSFAMGKWHLRSSYNDTKGRKVALKNVDYLHKSFGPLLGNRNPERYSTYLRFFVNSRLPPVSKTTLASRRLKMRVY